MLKIFKRTKEDDVYSPVAGTCIKIEDVKDQMFANKLLGDGIAILPSKICANRWPIDNVGEYETCLWY